MPLSFFQQLIQDLQATSAVEFVAVLAGIASVVLSRAENIWLYPVGLINTIFYIWLSLNGHLLGEASVNIFYTVMSLYGWWLWGRRKKTGGTTERALKITFSSQREWLLQLLFAGGIYAALFCLLRCAQQSFAPGAIPWADAFCSATAYTGMWLMARKKAESWYWWLATDIASVPLYYVKGYAFTSVQFLVFTALAVAGLASWWRKASSPVLPPGKEEAFEQGG